MKLEKIIALIEKAGFKYKAAGKRVGVFEEHEVSHYEKGIDIDRDPQFIQLALPKGEKERVNVSFSLNVPSKLRDEVYAIMNEPADEVENTLGM